MSHIWTIFFAVMSFMAAVATNAAPDTASWLGLCFLSVCSVYAALYSLICEER